MNGHMEHGKWIVVDPSDDKADNETVAAFEELRRQIQSLYEEGPAPSMLQMLEILNSEE